MSGSGPSLAHICEAIVDCEHKTAPTQEDGIPSIRTTNIGRGRLDLSGVYRVSEETYEEWTKRAVPQGGDLILAREAPVGNVALIPPNLRVCLGQRTVLLRPDQTKVDPVFLNYRLLARDIQGRFEGLASGATVPHLNVRDIRAFQLPRLPPLSLQVPIGRLLACYDHLIENNTRRIEILDEMAQAIYREWFVNFRFPGHEDVEMVDSELGLIPEGWGLAELDTIAERVRNGVDPTGLDPGITYVGLGDIPRESFTLQNHGRAGDVKSRKWRFERGDVLFGRLRPYFHKVLFADQDGISSTDTIVIRATEESDRYFLLQLVFTEEFVAYASKTAGGTDRPRARWSDLRKYQLALPGTDLRQRLRQVVGPMVELASSLARQNKILQETRDLLLPKLVSGEIDVSELDIDTSGLPSWQDA